MVMDEATMSQSPAAREARIVSNTESFHSTSRPRLPAMASTSSTSKPVYSPGDPSFSNSNGEYGMSEHTVRVPSLTRPRSAGTTVVSELAPDVPSVVDVSPVSASLSSSPHALATKPNTTSNANSIRQD